MSDIDAFINSAHRTSEALPIIKFKEVGDGFQATVLDRMIRDIPSSDKSKPPTKTLIVELELDEPRSQVKNVKNESTGLLEPTTITGTKWSWFVKENSQMLSELEAAMGPNRRPGSPNPGDRVRVKLIGLKPTKHPQPQQIFKIQYKPYEGEPQQSTAPAPAASAASQPAADLGYTDEDMF